MRSVTDGEISGAGVERVSVEGSPSGAKARMTFMGLMYGLKPVPFKLTHYVCQEEAKASCCMRDGGRASGAAL